MTEISHHEIRSFIPYLQQKRCFTGHRFNYAQDRGLLGDTINCYLPSVRSFFSGLVSDGIITTSPFDRVKIHRPSRKIIPTFSNYQIWQLLDVIDTSTAEGYRDNTIILTLLDTGPWVSELFNLHSTKCLVLERKYDLYYMESLKNGVFRPRRVRQPSALLKVSVAVQRLREQYPRWGKDKLKGCL